MLVLALLVTCCLVLVQSAPLEAHLRTAESRSSVQARLQSPLEAHVYVISLAKAVERRQSMQDNLANFAVNVSFVDAMQATLQAEDIMVRQPNGSHEVLWHGAWPPKSCTHEPVGEYKRVGTTFSHLVAVHTAYHAGREVAIVLEDDMTFMQWPTQRLLFTAPPGWEVLQLYSMGPKLQAEYSQPSALWLQWTFDFWSAGAYIINRNGMRKILELYSPASLTSTTIRGVQLPDPPPCDSEDFIYRPTQSYTCTDLFVYEKEGSSTIHDDDARMQIHRHARKHVQYVWNSRGSLH